MVFQKDRTPKYGIEKTDIKNPFLCQVKNKNFFSWNIPPLISFSWALLSSLPSSP
jgi:hypothetical protein